MKRFSVLFMVLCLSLTTITAAEFETPRKKVAVVFSGGGAFGAIHVGALKVIEESGIPVDMVVGTSMGSIVGALYSVGYDSNDIATMFRTMDWTKLFLDRSDPARLSLDERDRQNTYIYSHDFYVRGALDPQPGGVIRGSNVEATFKRYLHGYTDSINFLTDMPRSFACVATDLVTDSAVILTHGNLVESIRSSMSIPGVFTPVHTGEMVLVDGGAKNNFAADVARQLGADIVIGVKFDLGLGTDKQYRKMMDVLERSAGSDVSRRAQENEKYCDLLVKVPVRGYTSGSFKASALEELMQRGETATREKLDSLLLLKELAGVPRSKDCSIHLRAINDAKDITADHGILNAYSDSALVASVGLRFDSENFVAAQVNGRYYMRNKQLDLTLRVGMRSKLRLAFDFMPLKSTRIGASYEVAYQYSDIYTRGKRSNNLSFIYQNADLKLFQLQLLNFDFKVGIGWEHYHLFKGLWNEHSVIEFPQNEHYFNYHFKARYDNEDTPYFTTQGVRAEAKFSYFTDNFARWKGHTGFASLMTLFRATIPVTSSTHLRPQLLSRMVFGSDVPTMAGNVVGGISYGKFFPQQLPFVGFGQSEFIASKFVSASVRLQQRIAGKHYVVVDGVVAEQNNKLGDIFKNSPMWGARAGYFYDSGFVGPLGATLSWSNHTHRLNFFLSLGYDF